MILAFLIGMIAGAGAIIVFFLLITRDNPEPMIAGEAIAPGDPVYMGRDGKWYKSKPMSFETLNEMSVDDDVRHG